ncbi:TcaA NTF2-like domain-containing protein [Pontibacillus salipaludis]|uniref:TcaA NTF2-like domain-containing protein n=1 Tax=Pontibacillus salipaludis TaxID=1697394 RepID=UPI0031E51415
MRFCRECSEALGEGQDFCTACGTKLLADLPEVRYKRTPPMSKKKKRTLTSLGILAVVLLIAHFTLSTILDPTKKIQAMDQAMETKNASAFLHELSLEENALLNENEYFTYLNEAGWTTMKEQLSTIIASNEGHTTGQEVTDDDGNPVFIAKKRAIVPKLYYTYDIKAIPATITVSSDLVPSTITTGDHTTEISNNDTFYNLAKAYPGTYTLKGQAENKFGTFSNQLDMEVKRSSGKQELLFPFDYKTYSLTSNEMGATLFINGDSTGLPLIELNEIGPIPVGAPLKVHAQWITHSGETIRSEVIDTQYVQGDQIELQIHKPREAEEAQAVQEEQAKSDPVDSGATAEGAADHVIAFRSAYERALNEHNFSLMASYLQKGSHAEKELYDYMLDLETSVYTYDFRENNVIQTKKVSEQLVEVDMEEMFIFTNHLGEQIRYDRTKRYMVVFENGSYKIQKILINDTIRKDL